MNSIKVNFNWNKYISDVMQWFQCARQRNRVILRDVGSVGSPATRPRPLAMPRPSDLGSAPWPVSIQGERRETRKCWRRSEITCQTPHLCRVCATSFAYHVTRQTQKEMNFHWIKQENLLNCIPYANEFNELQIEVGRIENQTRKNKVVCKWD